MRATNRVWSSTTLTRANPSGGRSRHTGQGVCAAGRRRHRFRWRVGGHLRYGHTTDARTRHDLAVEAPEGHGCRRVRPVDRWVRRWYGHLHGGGGRRRQCFRSGVCWSLPSHLPPPLRSTSDVDLDPTPACYPPAMAGTRVPSKATLSMPSRQPTPCRWPRPTTSNGSSSPSSMAQHTLPCARHAWRHPRAHPSRGTASSATSAMPITMRPPPRVSRASCVMHPSRARHGLRGADRGDDRVPD